MRTDKGRFEQVTGSLQIERKANPQLLVTPNPLSFEAASVERLDENTYRIYHAKLTVCDPARPTWTFGAKEGDAARRPRRGAALCELPAVPHPADLFAVRQCAGGEIAAVGISDAGNQQKLDQGHHPRRRLLLGADELGGHDAGRATAHARGAGSRTSNIRMLPSENTTLSANYFGVVDRLGEGGHSLNLKLNTQLAGGWHVAADFNQLTSLTFQEVFSPTFSEAVNSEVNTTAFATKDFDGFSFSVDAHNYKDLPHRAAGDLHRPAHDAGDALRFGGPGAVEELAALCWVRRFLRRGAPQRPGGDGAGRNGGSSGEHGPIRKSQRVCAARDDPAALGRLAGRDADVYVSAALFMARRT